MRSATTAFRTMTAAAAVLVLGLSGSAAIAAESSAHHSSVRTNEVTVTDATATDTRAGRLRKCRDLKCKVWIREGQSFRANGRYGITRVRFPQISRNNIQVRATGPGIALSCGGTAPMYCTMNGVDLTVRKVRGEVAHVVRFRP